MNIQAPQWDLSQEQPEQLTSYGMPRSQETPDFTLGSQYSSFKADLKPSILIRGTFQLILSSLSPILTMIAVFYQNFVSIYFAVSTANTSTINSFNLGTSFLYVFGYNLMYSFNSNLIALISQAHGARDPFTISLNFQRALLFQFPLFAVFFIVMVFYVNAILPFMGITSDPSEIADSIQFIHWSSLSVLLTGIYEVGRIYLSGQNHFNEPCYAQIFSTLLNAILAWSLFESYGLIGLAIARSVSELVSVLIVFAFILRMKLTDWTLQKTTILMGFSKFSDYATFIFPGGVATFLQLFYVEMLSVCVMHAMNQPTTTLISFVNLRPLMFAIPLGTCISVASFVGQSIGEAAKKKAQTASLIGAITCCVEFLIQTIFWYFLQDQFANLLSIVNAEGVLDEFDRLFVFVVVFIESIQFMLTAILKGIGMLHQNVKFYLIGFYFIGISFTVSVHYAATLSLNMIWIAYILSQLVVCAAQARFLLKVDWDTLLFYAPIVGVDNDIELPILSEHDQQTQK